MAGGALPALRASMAAVEGREGARAGKGVEVTQAAACCGEAAALRFGMRRACTIGREARRVKIEDFTREQYSRLQCD